MASDKVSILNGDSFEKEVIQADKPVLVDFWAPWCGPCMKVAPIFEELALEFDEKVKFAKVNVDDEGELAHKFKIMSIPTMVLFKNGEAIKRLIGVRSKNELTDFINTSI